MKELKDIIAENICALRTERKMTQSELAVKLNYTDKSVSKWEHGDVTPSIEVLKNIAEIFDVSIDYLTTEKPDEIFDRKYSSKVNNPNKIIITLLAVSMVWIIATIVFVYAIIFTQTTYWQIFIAAVPLSTIVLIVFNGIWGKRKFVFILVSILTWSILATIYFQLINYNLWALFIIGAPLQIATILWSQLTSSKYKKRKKV